jgi:hypothetical protein
MSVLICYNALMRLDDKQLIAGARDVLLLLEDGKQEEAMQKIAMIDAALARDNSPRLTTDVIALWEQVEIAVNNLSNPRYFEEVKEELNRVAFDYNQSHPQ